MSKVSSAKTYSVRVSNTARAPRLSFRWALRLKGVLDLVGALFLIVVLAPLWLTVMILVKLTSPGPVFFVQTRVGENGKPFPMYKFRSMVKDAEARRSSLEESNEAKGHLFKIKDDPRITVVGKWLRRLSLDELPQLINVVRGEMSLVGPRPPLPREVRKYTSLQRRRLEATPGMTGLWQVSGRSKLPFDEMVKLDVFYIDHWTLGLDISILLRTIPAVFRNNGAY